MVVLFLLISVSDTHTHPHTHTHWVFHTFTPMKFSLFCLTDTNPHTYIHAHTHTHTYTYTPAHYALCNNPETHTRDNRVLHYSLQVFVDVWPCFSHMFCTYVDIMVSCCPHTSLHRYDSGIFLLWLGFHCVSYVCYDCVCVCVCVCACMYVCVIKRQCRINVRWD